MTFASPASPPLTPEAAPKRTLSASSSDASDVEDALNAMLLRLGSPHTPPQSPPRVHRKPPPIPTEAILQRGPAIPFVTRHVERAPTFVAPVLAPTPAEPGTSMMDRACHCPLRTPPSTRLRPTRAPAACTAPLALKVVTARPVSRDSQAPFRVVSPRQDDGSEGDEDGIESDDLDDLDADDLDAVVMHGERVEVGYEIGVAC